MKPSVPLVALAAVFLLSSCGKEEEEKRPTAVTTPKPEVQRKKMGKAEPEPPQPPVLKMPTEVPPPAEQEVFYGEVDTFAQKANALLGNPNLDPIKTMELQGECADLLVKRTRMTAAMNPEQKKDAAARSRALFEIHTKITEKLLGDSPDGLPPAPDEPVPAEGTTPPAPETPGPQ